MLPISLVLLGVGLLFGIVGMEFLSTHAEDDEEAEEDAPELWGGEETHDLPDDASLILPVEPAYAGHDADPPEAELEALCFSEADLLALPDLFSTRGLDGSFRTVLAGEGSTVSVMLPEGDGGFIHVIEADHVDTMRHDDMEVTRCHGGTNLYYVPEGATFPDGLKWSEDGGALFSEDAELEAEALAAGIKSLARIESGVSFFQKSLENGGLDFQNGDLGSPEIVSNVPISR